MTTAFIASEYNPFHNGHKYHIEKTREAGADTIISIMSGNFVQRGEPAIAEKHIRAKAAILGGADLVVELPTKYATSTATYFAKGFIDTVNAMGIEGIISFGASNSINELLKIKEVLFSEECENFANLKIKDGFSYPKAKAEYVRLNYPDIPYDILEDANNILALEYLNALDKTKISHNAVAITRKGVKHDSEITSESYASASHIRNTIYKAGLQDSIDFIPEKIFDIYNDMHISGLFPCDKDKFELIALTKLISVTSDELTKINNVNGGLENRILEAIRTKNSLEDIYNFVKSKHFTHSRVRQIILHSILGIKKDDLDMGVSYIRVLAFNNKGREMLQIIKNAAEIPVITNLSQLKDEGTEYSRDAEIDYVSGKIFNLCTTNMIYTNPEYQIPPVYVDM